MDGEDGVSVRIRLIEIVGILLLLVVLLVVGSRVSAGSAFPTDPDADANAG